MDGQTIGKDSIADLGLQTNAEVIGRLVDLDSKTVVDVGCGDMGFSRQLVALGASVLAIDPDPIQAVKNLSRPLEDGLSFHEASGEHLPVTDSSVDGVVFAYSLHHVPEESYPDLWQEVRRVLKPGGFLLVIEPVDCPLNQVMKLFHDEDRERAAAWDSLTVAGKTMFEKSSTVEYHSITNYPTFEDFVQHFSSRSFNTLYSESDVRAKAVEEAYQRHVGPDGMFLSPKRLMLCERLR
ncbi:MAG: class I SAM-dependent methyltransferase [Pirellulaceae bacterium]